jgi:hypothetical protein
MKQKLDEARTLAIKLFQAAQAEKMRQPKEIWGDDRLRNWRDLPSESVAVWDAVAIRAYDLLKGHNVEQCMRRARMRNAPNSKGTTSGMAHTLPLN